MSQNQVPASSQPTHITNTSTNPSDPWFICVCGNTPESGFSHSDAHGTSQDDYGAPTDAWDGLHYKCPCGVVFRGSDLLIVTRLTKAYQLPRS